MAAAATTVDAHSVTDESENQFNPVLWAAGVLVVCLIPLLLMALGVDFSTRLTPLSPAAAGAMTQANLGEAIHAAARGSYPHTLLEWSATASAVVLFALAFMQYRITKESSVMIIGVALVCAGAMDAFHTLAADRLITAQADRVDASGSDPNGSRLS